jgi:hypothetical protein
MKRRLINKFILVCVCSSLTCCNLENREQTNTKLLDKPEQFWVGFSTALKRGDTKYLIAHSLDSIQCGNCAIDTITDSKFYRADFLFTRHLEKFKLTEHHKEYSIASDEGVYRVNYRIEWKQAPAGAYNEIYNFIDTPEGFKFQGMFPVP